MARRPQTAGSEQDDDAFILSDTDLGIGEDVGAPTAPAQDDRFAAAIADPAVAAAIEQIVQQRVAELAKQQTGAAAAPGIDILAAMKVLAEQMASAINRSTAATMEQMPGHVKPIPVEEVEARAAAWTEMTALLRDTNTRYIRCMEQGRVDEAEAIEPRYLLREDFFGPGDAGSEMYLAGSTIRWFGPPGTYMEPKSATAVKISDAMWRYIGGHEGPTAEDIGSYVSQMRRPSMPGANIPEMPDLVGPMRGQRLGASLVANVGVVDVGPNRIMGTLIEEIKGGFGRPAYVVER